MICVKGNLFEMVLLFFVIVNIEMALEDKEIGHLFIFIFNFYPPLTQDETFHKSCLIAILSLRILFLHWYRGLWPLMLLQS